MLYQRFTISITIAISVAISSFFPAEDDTSLRRNIVKERSKAPGLFFKFNNCLGSLARCYLGSAALTKKRSGFALAVTLGATVALFKKVPDSALLAEEQVFCGGHLVREASMERIQELTKVVVIFSQPASVQNYSALPGYKQFQGQF